MLLKALNEFRKDLLGVHMNCQCSCNNIFKENVNSSGQSCEACAFQFKSLTALWSSVLCLIRPRHLWHKR